LSVVQHANMASWVKKLGRQEFKVAIFRQQLQIPIDKITGAQHSNFAPKFPPKAV